MNVRSSRHLLQLIGWLIVGAWLMACSPAATPAPAPSTVAPAANSLAQATSTPLPTITMAPPTTTAIPPTVTSAPTATRPPNTPTAVPSPTKVALNVVEGKTPEGDHFLADAGAKVTLIEYSDYL